MGTRKIAKVDVLPSFPLATNKQLFVKSLLEGWIMQFKPPNTSTTSSPPLSHLKQSEMHSRKTAFTLLLSKNDLCSKRPIAKLASNSLSIMLTGRWRIGRGFYGLMRQKSTGLDQMGGCIPGKKEVNHFLTELPHPLSNMEEAITLWYGVVWGGMEWEY